MSDDAPAGVAASAAGQVREKRSVQTTIDAPSPDAARLKEVLAEVRKGADRPLEETPAWRVVLEAADRPELRLPLAWALLELLGDGRRAPSGQTVAELLERVVDEYEKGVEPPDDSSSARSFLRWLSGARRSHLHDVPASARRPGLPAASEATESMLDDLDDLDDLDLLDEPDVPERPDRRRVRRDAPRPAGRRERVADAEDPLEEAEQAVKRLRAIPFNRR